MSNKQNLLDILDRDVMGLSDRHPKVCHCDDECQPIDAKRTLCCIEYEFRTEETIKFCFRPYILGFPTVA